jgi:hypothetical protein
MAETTPGSGPPDPKAELARDLRAVALYCYATHCRPTPKTVARALHMTRGRAAGVLAILHRDDDPGSHAAAELAALIANGAHPLRTGAKS